MTPRCPRCGTRTDAEPFTAHVRPGASRTLRERLDVVRRELGLASAGDALEAAVRAAALDLNVGRGVVSRYAGDPRASHDDREEPMGETEHENVENADAENAAEGQPGDDGGATAGSSGESADESTDQTSDGETQTGADPQPE